MKLKIWGWLTYWKGNWDRRYFFWIFNLMFRCGFSKRMHAQSQQHSQKKINTRKKMWKVNKKDARTKSLTLFWCLWCYVFTQAHFFSVSIIDFEQVNICLAVFIVGCNQTFFMFVRQSAKKAINVRSLQEKCFGFVRNWK